METWIIVLIVILAVVVVGGIVWFIFRKKSDGDAAIPAMDMKPMKL